MSPASMIPVRSSLRSSIRPGPGLMVALTLAVPGTPLLAEEVRIDFEGQALDAPPSGFTLTGTGADGRWLVQADPAAPSGTQVLVQVSDAGRGQEFPLAILDEVQRRTCILR